MMRRSMSGWTRGRRRTTRHIMRKGHTTSDRTATTTVTKNTKKDERNAKPAPGPMYPCAGDGFATTSAVARAQEITQNERPRRYKSGSPDAGLFLSREQRRCGRYYRRRVFDA